MPNSSISIRPIRRSVSTTNHFLTARLASPYHHPKMSWSRHTKTKMAFLTAKTTKCTIYLNLDRKSSI